MTNGSATSGGMGTNPPGWYPDPWEQAEERWWNGFEWSDRTRAPATEPERPLEAGSESDKPDHDTAHDDTPADIGAMPDKPGWYPDPDGEADERWWNGTVWTDRTNEVFEPGEQSPRMPYKGVVAVIVGMAIVAALMASGGDDSSPSRSPGPSTPGSPIEAWLVCQDFTERILRAPSTAEFPSRSDATISARGSGWVVESYVDAENAFGAMLRQPWLCTATLDGDTWRGSSTLLE